MRLAPESLAFAVRLSLKLTSFWYFPSRNTSGTKATSRLPRLRSTPSVRVTLGIGGSVSAVMAL